jgi:hypothetical protein
VTRWFCRKYTCGLLNWGGANEARLKEVLPKAAERMMDRLGSAAAAIACILSFAATSSRRTAEFITPRFFLGRDGREIGR